MGDSTRPFLFIAIAAIVNVILDLVFVGAMGMESGGAALATVISQAASFIISMIYLYIRRRASALTLSSGVSPWTGKPLSPCPIWGFR